MSPSSSSFTELRFCTSHQYSSKGNAPASLVSQKVVSELKQDGFWQRNEGDSVSFVEVIPKMVESAVSLLQEGRLDSEILNARTLLVPIPGHSPRRDDSSVWPAMRICHLFQQHRIGVGVCPLVERVKSLPKSAWVSSGERPTPEDHFGSVQVGQLSLIDFESITLVDDVVTQGSTLLGISSRIRETFPNVPIFGFALVRTINPGEVAQMIEPVNGIISERNGRAIRRP